MLGSSRVVGFIPTKNPKRAREFYEQVLGLAFESEDAFALVLRAGGTSVRIARSGDFTPFPFTIFGWEVEDIERTAAELKERGVRFERFDGMAQSELGIWNAPGGAKVAWFKDPDGNLLALSQHPGRA